MGLSVENPCFSAFYNRAFLISVAESSSCYNCSGLWQDWQERCHRQSVCGLKQHGHRAPSLVRHAGQSKETHRSVARAQARRRSGCPAGCSEKIEQPKPPRTYPCSALYPVRVNTSVIERFMHPYFWFIVILCIWTTHALEMLCCHVGFESLPSKIRFLCCFTAIHDLKIPNQMPPSFKQYDLYR